MHAPPQLYRWTTDTRGNEFLVMEYVRNGPLDVLLMARGDSLKMRDRLAMCEQVLGLCIPDCMCESTGETLHT